MSRISKLVSALTSNAVQEAKAIYDAIQSDGTPTERQNAKYIMSTI